MSLQSEVGEEIAFEGALLQKLTSVHRDDRPKYALVVVLIGLMIVAIIGQPYVFLLWLFIGFLIYSYNFIIILIPTTTTRIRPGERGTLKNVDKATRWLAIRLLLNNKRLAVEIGLTVFLGGMVPLAWSFAVIFGITAFFAAYYGFVVGFITLRTATTVLIQIGFVFLLYTLFYLLEPRSHGPTRLAVLDETKIVGNSTPRTAIIIMLAAVVLIGLLTSLLGFWALLLPAVTIPALLEAFDLLDRFDLILFVLVLVAQLFVMRQIQGYASRRMASKRLAMRLHSLKDISNKLQAIEEGSVDEGRLRSLRKRFYSIVIYDIVEHDLYGFMPVYLIGPRLRYVLDTAVLTELE